MVRMMPEPRTLNEVAKAARDAMSRVPGEPCDDPEGCLRLVYLAGVADALAWATGAGPLPTSFRRALEATP